MCISRDVTPKEEMILALNESEERYRLIVETANEGILSSDGLQRINYVNEKLVDLLGYNATEMLGRTLIEFICESELEDHELRVDNRKRLISERFERCFIHKDGSVRWMISFCFSYYNGWSCIMGLLPC